MNADCDVGRRLVVVAVAMSLACVASVEAQDVVRVSPETVKVILENDTVRIIESTIPPGTVQAMHSHPATIVYYLTASTVRALDADGTSVVTERQVGEVAYREPLTHSAENVGTTPAKTLVIELKPVSKP